MNPEAIPEETRATFATNPEAAARAYSRLGYHVEPNVWTSEDCARFVEAARTLPTALDGSMKPAMNPHKTNPVFMDALRRASIVGIMERLCGGPVSAIQSQFFFCRPGTPGFTAHQDNFYVRAAPDAFCSAWSALDDVDATNGGLIVYPGSHLEALLPVREVPQPENVGQDPNANRQEVVFGKQYPRVDLNMRKGSVVFIHAHLVHASNANRTKDRFRHALLNTYVRRGTPFRPGAAAGRTEIDVYD